MTKFWNFKQPKAISNEAERIEDPGTINSSSQSESTCIGDTKSQSEVLEKTVSGAHEEITDSFNKENSISVSTSNLENKKEDKIIYYAVCIPPDVLSSVPQNEGTRPLYFTSKQEALQEVKKYKGARFKTFHTAEEALAFVVQSSEQMFSAPINSVPVSSSVVESEKSVFAGEKSSPYKGPKSQDMVKLRKSIEAGDILYFQQTVWSNPRYLISSGDTPAILQEGFRYNALHVAAKFKRPEFCEMIIKTIEDPKFMEMLYNDDAPDIRSQRITYVTDLYLNMPDKGLCETPLHFASKFGCLKAVQILVSHPLCDSRRKNKYGLEAKEIICERCPTSSSDLKKGIEDVFQEQYFVPVLRAEDNSVQPFIGKPYPQNAEKSILETIQEGSPRETRLSVMAVAGPMSPKEAELFYRFWKTPPSHFSRSRYKILNKVRLSDTEKGLEILGRHLAKNFNASWTEYWPSLNAWCDLSTKEGLDVLEQHLRELYFQFRLKNSNLECDASPCLRGETSYFTHLSPTSVSSNNTGNTSSSSSSHSSDGMNSLCSGFERLHVTESENLLNFMTSPDMPGILGSVDNKDSCKNCDSNCSGSPNQVNEDGVKVCCTPKRNVFGRSHLDDRIRRSKPERNFSLSPVSAEAGSSSSSRKKWSVTDYESHKSRDQIKSSFQDNYKCILSKDLIPSFVAPIKSITESILNVFSSVIFDSNPAVDMGMHLHLLLAEDVLPKLDYLLNCSLTSSEDFSCLHNIMSSIIFKEMQDHFVNHELDLLLKDIKNYTDTYFSANISENDDSFGKYSSQNCTVYSSKLKWQHLKCILRFILSGDLVAHGDVDSQKVCSCSWPSRKLLQDKEISVSKCLFNSSCSEEESSEKPCDDSSESSDDMNSFVTPPDSPGAILISSDEDDPVTPDEGLEIYVEGAWPSKADADVLRAIESVPVDPVQYPHISRWMHLVSLKDRGTIDSWPSPAAGRFRGKSIRTSGYFSPCPPQMSILPVPKSLSCGVRSSRSRNTEKNLEEARKLINDFIACEDLDKN